MTERDSSTGSNPAYRVGYAAATFLGAARHEAIAIGTGKQLFVDDHVIESLSAVRRTVNQFEKHPANPVLEAELPWEGQRLGEFVLLHDEDEGLFKCWYPGIAAFYDRAVTAADVNSGCAVSEDGLHWTKRQIPATSASGGGQGRYIMCLDPRAADPARRFKALCRGSDGWYWTSYSADGLTWTGPVEQTTMRVVDDPPYLQYDEQQGVFTFYRRFWTKSHRVIGGGQQWGWPGDRAVGLAMSRDFVYWQPNGALLLRADAADQRWARDSGGARADIHAMRGFPYEGIWLGFVERENLLLPAILKDGKALTNDDSCRLPTLACSRDGHSWHRLEDRAAPIPLGKPGEWDAADLGYPISRPVIAAGRIRVFYRGGNCTKFCSSWYGNVEHYARLVRENGGAEYYRHWKSMHAHPWNGRTFSIGLATMRTDGFVSLDGGRDEGVLTTGPLLFSGSRLVLNVAAKGKVAVEFLDECGGVSAGFGHDECDVVRGDEIAHTVTWRGAADVSGLSGKPVRLRFRLCDAKLYSFVFQP